MFKKTPIEATLDEEILALLAQMKTTDKTSKEYADLATSLQKLHELHTKSSISKETLATIAANLAGIGIIIFHERVHVIPMKAFSLIRKLF